MSESSPWPIRRSQVIRRARCPVCGSTRIETYGSRKGDDGRTVRYCRCRDCKDMRTQERTTFKVVVE